MEQDNRKQSKAKTRQFRLARELKYAGLVEYGVDLLIERSEYACAAAELQGGAHYV
jgi:hypothetical protein